MNIYIFLMEEGNKALFCFFEAEMLNHLMLSVVPGRSASSGCGTQGTPGALCHDLQQVAGLCASSLSL